MTTNTLMPRSNALGKGEVDSSILSGSTSVNGPKSGHLAIFRYRFSRWTLDDAARVCTSTNTLHR